MSASAPLQIPPARVRFPGKRSRRLLFAVAALILTGMVCQASAARLALKREIAAADRDPRTGIIRGTEAVDLGPDDARAACLLIHGFVGSRQDFAQLGEQLADAGFHVRMMRLPGHGTTPSEFARLGPEDLLGAARQELRRLQARYDRVYLVGFSMGGAISTCLAAEAGDAVSGLVLVAPYFRVTYRWYYLLPPMTWNAMFSPVIPYVTKGERFVRVNRREAVPHIFSYRAVPTAGAKTLEALGSLARDAGTLARVKAPVLMLQAEGDEAASPEAGAAAFESLASPAKTRHLYDGRSNHHLLWDYDGEDAARRITGFLLAREQGLGA